MNLEYQFSELFHLIIKKMSHFKKANISLNKFSESVK